MIKHHPNTLLLQTFLQGELPLALSVGVSAHIELCPHCQALAEKHTQWLAQSWAETETLPYPSDPLDGLLDTLLADLPDSITTQTPSLRSVAHLSTRPISLQRHEPKRWRQFGSIRRGRLPSLTEGKIRASLLDIAAGSQIPTHKHQGYELTLLLEGTFEDEHGTYQEGDFLYLDNANTHSPMTHDGCLCYSVSNAPLYFTQGYSQWLNPIGHFIY